MSHCAGVSGIFFGALGKAGVNVLAISQVNTNFLYFLKCYPSIVRWKFFVDLGL